MRVVLEHSWQVVVEVDDEYASKEHLEFAYNQGTHCADNEIEELNTLLCERIDPEEKNWELEGQLPAFQLWYDGQGGLGRFAFGCFCDVLLTRRVREAREGEPLGLIDPRQRWDEEGWD